MKKVLLLIGLVAFSMVSCQKEQEASPKDTSTRTVPSASIMSGGASYTGLVNGICTGPGDVCRVIPVIVIDTSGTDTSGVDTSKLLFAQLNGAIAVAQVFSSKDYQVVCNSLSAEEVAKLQSGTYVIEITSQTPDHITFIAQEGSVSSTNFDFAVQLNVIPQ